jgi:capsular polysaccharide biosynthesis protein
MAVRYRTLFKSKDLLNIPGNATLIIQGIAKRKSILKFVSQSKGVQFRVKVKILPPFYLLSPYQDSQNILVQVPRRQTLRANILRASRNPSLIFPIGRVGFEFQFACGADRPLLLERLQEALAVENLKVYVSREVAKYGYPTKFIDNTLEYELTRNWLAYDLILTRAKISIRDQKVLNLMTSNKLTIPEKQQTVDDLLPNHFFNEFFSTSPTERQLKNPRSVTGEAKIAEHSPTVDKYSNLWKLIHLNDATVLHGKIVFSEEEFYLGDNMKIPTFGSSYNQWPSPIFQNKSGRYFSPYGQYVGEPLEEAIFIGGTKNIMHFVVEDLPRIFLLDDFELSKSAPVIVAKTLGPEILSLIELLSRREVIQIDFFEMISVRNLYVLDFNNPLMATMSGDKKAAELLFSATILNRARDKFLELKNPRSVPQKRIFIRREPGLFRPLINARLLQWMLEYFFDFKTHFLQEKSLEEIYDIFVGAEVVIAEYGAGLANIIFIEKACKVVEIRGTSESSAIEYETLSGKLGHEHYLVKGAGKKLSRYGITRGPFKVSLLSVCRILLDLK